MFVAAVFFAGCGGDSGGSSAPPAAAGSVSASGAPAPPVADDWGDPAAAAASADVGPGSACPVPHRFKLAASWKPKDASALGFEAHGHLLSCEIDGKPAGVLGLMRVWTGSDTDPRRMLQSLVDDADGASEVRFRAPAGSVAGLTEVSFQSEGQPTRAFAVAGLMVEWRGLDEEEHSNGLPAYVLARQTLKPG
jgi:hypothetical protein